MNDIIAPELILLPARTDSPKPWSKEILRQFSAVPSDCWHLKANHSKPAPQCFYFWIFFCQLRKLNLKNGQETRKRHLIRFRHCCVCEESLTGRWTLNWQEIGIVKRIFLYIYFFTYTPPENTTFCFDNKRKHFPACLKYACRGFVDVFNLHPFVIACSPPPSDSVSFNLRQPPLQKSGLKKMKNQAVISQSSHPFNR